MVPDGRTCDACGAEILDGQAFALIDQHIGIWGGGRLEVRPGQQNIVASLCLSCSYASLNMLVRGIPKLLRKRWSF